MIAQVAGAAPCRGRGANVLGDPRIALTWLANELSRHGDTLGEGQFVTTGTCLVPLPIMPGEVVTADERLVARGVVIGGRWWHSN